MKKRMQKNSGKTQRTLRLGTMISDILSLYSSVLLQCVCRMSSFGFFRLFEPGHRVVGVDEIQTALENFFKDHSMEYTVETKNGIPAYTVIHLSSQIVLK